MAGKARRKRIGENIGIGGTAAMMHQPGDHPHSPAADMLQLPVRPAPVVPCGIMGCHPLPQHRIAQRRKAEIGHQVDIRQPFLVAARRQLVAILIPDPVNGAFGATPKLQFMHDFFSRPTAHPRQQPEAGRIVARFDPIPR
jgi:hypothetical protein